MKISRTIRLLRRRVRRMTPINLVHDLLSPADRVGDGARRGGHALSRLVLRELPRREDAGGDQ